MATWSGCPHRLAASFFCLSMAYVDHLHILIATVWRLSLVHLRFHLRFVCSRWMSIIPFGLSTFAITYFYGRVYFHSGLEPALFYLRFTSIAYRRLGTGNGYEQKKDYTAPLTCTTFAVLFTNWSHNCGPLSCYTLVATTCVSI